MNAKEMRNLMLEMGPGNFLYTVRDAFYIMAAKELLVGEHARDYAKMLKDCGNMTQGIENYAVAFFREVRVRKIANN